MPHHFPNERSSSTTWEFRRVKIKRRPAGPASTAAKRRLLPLSLSEMRRHPMHITIRYRGGGECWWEIQARGETWHFPGYIALLDVMTTIGKTL